MSSFSADDHRFMARALELAARGRYTARPNPMVGCLLVRDGQVIGEGWHRNAGAPHAEINALNAVAGNSQAATAYVSLEPCSHEGRTPPCTSALIDAGVSRVVAAMQDPNPQVAGAGIAALDNAGVGVTCGLMESDARQLNAGFCARFERGRPFVRLKCAASLDGATAMQNGASQWITGEAARRDVQRLRAASGAIMTGVATVIADDPSLNVREKSIENDGLQPLRVVVDSRLRTLSTARMLKLPGETRIYCVCDDAARPLEDAGATVTRVSADSANAARTDLREVLEHLASLEINDVLVEAGPTLSGSLLSKGLVDELVIYLAPHIMGSETRGMFETPYWRQLDQRCPLELTDVRKVGTDMRITARPTGTDQ